MVIAKRFPRDEKIALERILNDCTDPDLADMAIYQYARGGTDISGPSIRLAEAIARRWGNNQFEVKEVGRSKGEDGVGVSEVLAYFWDQENNVRRNATFTARHWRDTKSGGYALKDERDIYELCFNQGARRLRACILACIPANVVKAAEAQCEATMSASADTSPEAQKKIVAAFAKYGVKKEHIEARIQRRLDAITAAQVVALRKIMTSLNDGMSKAEEWFALVDAPPKADFGGKKEEKAAKAKDVTAAADLWTFIEKNEIAEKSALKWLEIEKREDLTDERAVRVNRDELLADLVS